MQLAGLRSLVVEPDAPAHGTVFLLHGHGMYAEDLAPFAHTFGVHARFVVPQAPVVVSAGGYAWWPLDEERRSAALAAGPRDLWAESPPGLEAANRQLQSLVHEAGERWGLGAIALVGFSQGGMLACDVALRGARSVTALAALSASRIGLSAWTGHLDRVRGLPVLVAHGSRDSDLAFAAGEALRDMLAGAAADVTWVPHAEGHVIPLPVWRALRRFLEARLAPAGR